jgi:hypothetical protein
MLRSARPLRVSPTLATPTRRQQSLCCCCRYRGCSEVTLAASARHCTIPAANGRCCPDRGCSAGFRNDQSAGGAAPPLARVLCSQVVYAAEEPSLRLCSLPPRLLYNISVHCRGIRICPNRQGVGYRHAIRGGRGGLGSRWPCRITGPVHSRGSVAFFGSIQPEKAGLCSFSFSLSLWLFLLLLSHTHSLPPPSDLIHVCPFSWIWVFFFRVFACVVPDSRWLFFSSSRVHVFSHFDVANEAHLPLPIPYPLVLLLFFFFFAVGFLG